MKLRIEQITLAALVLFASSAAFAQYVWLDDKGTKQFSDTPPPASVPKNRILKEPSNPSVASKPIADTTPADSEKDKGTSTAAPTKGPMTVADREAEFKKRRAEQADNEKKAAEKAKHDAERARACEQNAAYQRTLSSGDRISTNSKSGERGFMSDEQRARELREVNRNLEGCK